MKKAELFIEHMWILFRRSITHSEAETILNMLGIQEEIEYPRIIVENGRKKIEYSISHYIEYDLKTGAGIWQGFRKLTEAGRSIKRPCRSEILTEKPAEYREIVFMGAIKISDGFKKGLRFYGDSNQKVIAIWSNFLEVCI